jgi:hypothetical protein
VNFLFAEYRHFSEAMFVYLRERTPKPEEMKQDAYDRTLKARAFDLSRYLLPMATNTSLGQIAARSFEIRSRGCCLTACRFEAGKLLKSGARSAYNVNHASAERAARGPATIDRPGRTREECFAEVHSAPT